MKQSIQNGIVWLLGIALMSPLFGWSQGLITGTVSDENGMPLPGATVVVEETNAGTTTDFDGNYQISASTGQTLIFSYVGYESQSVADQGSKENLMSWCTYVLSGLKTEIEKIDRLSNYDYLKTQILLPALACSKSMKYIDAIEYKILRVTIENQIVQNATIKTVMKSKHDTSVSRYIRSLKEKKMLVSEGENSRKYHINFIQNLLLRGVIKQLEEKGFTPTQY